MHKNEALGLTSNDSAKFDDAHGVLKEDIEDAVYPAL